MPNPWTGKGNPYTREEVIERLHQTLREGKAIIAAGAGTGISAKFIEQGGGDLIIIYNSGRFRMAGHGSTSGLMSYGDANAVAMEIGEFEVLPVVEETPVICGVHATDPRRRMWHWLLKVNCHSSLLQKPLDTSEKTLQGVFAITSNDNVRQAGQLHKLGAQSGRI